jgi:hypothetical protein
MLDAPIRYNGAELNTVTDLGEGKRRGCIIEEFDYGRAAGVGYTEKRAQDDGLDASDVFMGPRYIALTGVVYGADMADVFDQMQTIRAAFTPTIAYMNDVADYGYIPLEFSLPTHDTAFAATGMAKLLEFRARPVGQPQFSVRRDTGAFSNGSLDENGGAMMWRVTLECKDPRMYVRPDKWYPFTGPVTGAAINNRGDYPTPVDILLAIGAVTATNSKLEIDVGGSNMTILLPSIPSGSVVRYSSELKVLTLQTPSDVTDVLRRDMLVFRNNTTHPLVPPRDGEVYNVRRYGTILPTLAAGTRLMFSEAFA